MSINNAKCTVNAFSGKYLFEIEGYVDIRSYDLMITAFMDLSVGDDLSYQWWREMLCQRRGQQSEV